MNDTVSLRDYTRQLLRDRPRSMTLRQIADETDLTIDFLSDFGAENRPDPSVNKVQTLYEYLTGKPLLTVGETA